MKTVKSIIFAVCVVLATANAFSLVRNGPSIIPRVVGGKDASEGQFPYQVSLRTKSPREHFCGGSILNSRFILTAAHCTVGGNVDPNNVLAVVGALHRVNGGVEIQLEKISPHELFIRPVIKNDISLIRTAEEIVFSRTIEPIALPTHDVAENTQVVLSGWGMTSYPGSPADHLQFAKTQTISEANCIEMIKRLPYPWSDAYVNLIRNSVVCTSNPKNVNIGEGDSGGPLVDISNPENKTLVGVMSWTLVLMEKGYPDGYTRVNSYLGWIDDKMKEQSNE